ncbi:MAG: HPr kinase/phosphatase C-terminal domain-containing protein [Alphaproteobacteria bacterium]|nr:HPr kinase/phosphatase C-terminal domain-containing protein [Alphaproteobacteria bacterium]
MINIHATLISYKNNGILFMGKSASGKSDLALRMILEKNAFLVADDRVIIRAVDNQLYGHAPQELFGKMEIRHLGIAQLDAKKEEKISLCVELCNNRQELERMPVNETINFLGVSIDKIKLYPFDCSTICKIIAKICGIIS